MPQSGLLTLPAALPPRRRRSMGAATWRMWIGCHRAGGKVALSRTSKYQRNPSAVEGAAGHGMRTHGRASAPSLRRVGNGAFAAQGPSALANARAGTSDPGGKLAEGSDESVPMIGFWAESSDKAETMELRAHPKPTLLRQEMKICIASFLLKSTLLFSNESDCGNRVRTFSH